MASSIKVTPEQLETSASRFEGKISQYRSLYNNLYAEVQKMRATWSGQSNQQYTTQIEGFRNDFVELEKLLERYVLFIRKSAADYRATETNLANEARTKLSTGK